MLPLLFIVALAAPPDLPTEAEYSLQLLQRWERDAKLSRLETAAVESIATKWEAEHDAWRDVQCSRIVTAMERTWELPVGSAERDAAAMEVWRLQREKVARQLRFVADVRKLIKLRGRWPTEQA